MPKVDGVNLTFGRCWECNVAYRWRGKPRLKDARCPKCHKKLHQTVHYLRSAPWLDEKPETAPGKTQPGILEAKEGAR